MMPSKWGRIINSGNCKFCQDRILWVRTPQHRTMPVNFTNPDLAHFATCPNYERRGKPEAEPECGQLSLFDLKEE